MTINQLQCFLEAAKYLNFSRAADALYIHPSTMSRSITAMEEELGTPLFIRLKYTLQLTEVGSRFRVEAEEVVERYNRMILEAKASAEELQGSLSLLTPQLYYQMLADAYRAFYLKNPQIDFAVDVAPFSHMDTICKTVEDRVVDLGITFSSNFHNDNGVLESYKICEEEQVLTLPLDHPLAGRKSCRISDLKNTTLLLADHQGKENLQMIVSRVDRSANPIQLMHTASGETMLLRFTAGLGVMLMPGIVARNSGGNFACVRLDDLDTRVDVLLVWRRDHDNPAVDAFLECVRNSHPMLHPIASNEFS